MAFVFKIGIRNKRMQYVTRCFSGLSQSQLTTGQDAKNAFFNILIIQILQETFFTNIFFEIFNIKLNIFTKLFTIIIV